MQVSLEIQNRQVRKTGLGLNHFHHGQHRHIFSSSAAGEGDGGCDEDEYEVPFEYSPHPLVVGDHLYTLMFHLD